eukprot:scaffold1828_cov258-Pinguiococcus_pyrenoidosus.AAC.1
MPSAVSAVTLLHLAATAKPPRTVVNIVGTVRTVGMVPIHVALHLLSWHSMGGGRAVQELRSCLVGLPHFSDVAAAQYRGSSDQLSEAKLHQPRHWQTATSRQVIVYRLVVQAGVDDDRRMRCSVSPHAPSGTSRRISASLSPDTAARRRPAQAISHCVAVQQRLRVCGGATAALCAPLEPLFKLRASRARVAPPASAAALSALKRRRRPRLPCARGWAAGDARVKA